MQSRARRAESLQITRPTENRGKRRSHTKTRSHERVFFSRKTPNKKTESCPPPPAGSPHRRTPLKGHPRRREGTFGTRAPLAARPPAANYSGAPSAYFSSGARRSHGRRLLRLHLIKPTAYIRTPARSFRLPPVAAPPCQANGAYKNARGQFLNLSVAPPFG